MMDMRALENYLFIPDSTIRAKGTLYELTKSDVFAPNSFVIIPYQHPQKEKVKPQFYSIKNTFHIHANEEEIQAKQSTAILLSANTSKQAYIQKVNYLKEQIQQGNIYEINYCISFFAENFVIDPIQLFNDLVELSRAPYAALLKLGNDFIISASPELFLKKEGYLLSSKPIKGTIKRGVNPIEDAQLKDILFKSIKERTENVMAVDVARNDLSQVAKKGTVQVNKLYTIETFETVHQMVSTVSCELKDGTTFENIIDCTFPMASMTGAPKIAAMNFIETCEDFERKVYSGAMGLIDEKGDFSLSVIIRSIFYNQETKHLSIAVGGAITYLCDAEQEYEECLLKAKALLKVLNANLIGGSNTN